MISNRERTDFSFKISGVMKGFEIRERPVVDLKAACLSTTEDITEQN
jgi:hypothetical protein